MVQVRLKLAPADGSVQTFLYKSLRFRLSQSNGSDPDWLNQLVSGLDWLNHLVSGSVWLNQIFQVESGLIKWFRFRLSQPDGSD